MNNETDSSDNDEYPITLPSTNNNSDTVPDMPHVNLCLLNGYLGNLYKGFRKQPGKKLFYRLPLFAALNESLVIPESSIGALALNTGVELTIPKHYIAHIESSSTNLRVRNNRMSVFDNAMNESLILHLEHTSITSVTIVPGQLVAYVRFFYVYKHLQIQSRFYLFVQ